MDGKGIRRRRFLNAQRQRRWYARQVEGARNPPDVDVHDGFPSNEDDEVDNAAVRDVSGRLGHFQEFELR
jgi:hypothetical protein